MTKKKGTEVTGWIKYWEGTTDWLWGNTADHHKSRLDNCLLKISIEGWTRWWSMVEMAKEEKKAVLLFVAARRWIQSFVKGALYQPRYTRGEMRSCVPLPPKYVREVLQRWHSLRKSESTSVTSLKNPFHVHNWHHYIFDSFDMAML